MVYLNHKPIFPQINDPIEYDRRYSSSMENQEFENKNTKKSTWENNLVFDRNEEQSKYLKSIFFFDFSNS